MNTPRVELIAEFCQNHGGDFDVLTRMVAAAADAGATHGKMQTIFADRISYRPEFEFGVESAGRTRAIRRPYQAEYDRLKALELDWDHTRRFVRLCQDHGLIPLTTCFARTDVKAIAACGFEAVKVASYDCASFPMLRELGEHFQKLYVSTGATFDGEVEQAARLLSAHDVTFLHCVTIYPTPLDEIHLARMDWLRTFSERVGFSDHTLVARDGILASKAAIHMGARVVERHFTILPADATRDGPVSIRPRELADLAAFASMSPADQATHLDNAKPDWRIMVGSRHRQLSDGELLNRAYYRGRFASPRKETADPAMMVYNWEETAVG